jgi:hypothetical protein
MRRFWPIPTVLVACLAIVLLGVLPGKDSVGQDMSPEKAKQLMDAMMGPMMENMMETMYGVMARPETAERLATFVKNYHEALVAKGFSEEEAMRIVLATGMPTVPSMK